MSFTAPGAFTASKQDLLTPVVHKPGNRPYIHTERKKKSLLEIIFPLFKIIIIIIFFWVEGRAADVEFLFNLAWILILPNCLLTRF